jgi:hypothetical protein
VNLEEATKRITLEYIKTGCEGYQRLLQYINGDMKGNLWLCDTKVSYLPQGLKVGGILDLHNTPITSLPKGLKVGGSLDLRNTHISELPKGLVVRYSLYLYNTPMSKKYTIKQLKQMLPNVKSIGL